MSDDFCHIAITAKQPVHEVVVYWRNGVNGSYANIALMSLLGPLGYDVARLFPALLPGLTTACYAGLLIKALAMAGMARHRRIAAFGLSALLAGAASHSLAAGAALYWYTASVKYTAPLALTMLYLLILLHVVDKERGSTRNRAWAIAGGWRVGRRAAASASGGLWRVVRPPIAACMDSGIRHPGAAARLPALFASP